MGEKNSLPKRINTQNIAEQRPESLPEEVKEVSEVDETDSENGSTI